MMKMAWRSTLLRCSPVGAFPIQKRLVKYLEYLERLTIIPNKIKPEDLDVSKKHATITVKRKELGAVAVKPAEVRSGSKRDFTITYDASEELKLGDVIEVKLPAEWPVPTAFNYDDNKLVATIDGTVTPIATFATADKVRVYLDGPPSRVKFHDVSVGDNLTRRGDSVVRILIGGADEEGTQKGTRCQRLVRLYLSMTT